MSEDEVRLDLARRMEAHGWAVQGVEGSPTNWTWAYTIGLIERFDHPELVVAGLCFKIAARVLNELASRVQHGARLAPGVTTMIGRVPQRFVSVHPQQFDHGVFNYWFDHYRAFAPSEIDLHALQVIVPRQALCAGRHGRLPRLDRPEPALELFPRNRAERREARRRRPRRGRRPAPGPPR